MKRGTSKITHLLCLGALIFHNNVNAKKPLLLDWHRCAAAFGYDPKVNRT
jgi:hypothetical protein